MDDLVALFQNKNFLIWGTVIMAVLILLNRRVLAAEIKLFREDRKAWFRQFFKEWIVPLLWAAFLAFGVVRPFLLGPYKIPSGSMRNTFIEGDRIFVDKLTYRFHEPQRGDIIVFKYPQDKKKDFVKRLVGLPGETVEIRDQRVMINGKTLEDPPFTNIKYYNKEDWDYGKTGQLIEIPPGYYFVLGDNSAHSSDSRNWGFVPEKNIIGKAFCIWWPPDRVKLVK